MRPPADGGERERAMSTASISATRSESCTGNRASVSRAPALQLSLFRETSATSGQIVPNSNSTEEARRFLVGRVPNGTARLVAEELNAKPSRLNRELEGHALFSVDGFVGFARSLTFEDRLRLFAHLLAPFDFHPVPSSVRDLDDSAVG
jgi:hypothetical protein